MFDIGFLELLILGIVALVVVGPERLPGLVKNIGMWVGRLRRMLSGIKSEISEELRIEELRQQAKAREEQINQEVNSIKKPFSEAMSESATQTEVAQNAAVDSAATTAKPSTPNHLEEAASQIESMQSNKS